VVKDKLVALVSDSLTVNVVVVEVEVEVGALEDAVYGGVYFKSSTENEPTWVVTSRVSGEPVPWQAQLRDAPLSNIPRITFGLELGLRPTAG
jgi:hypothetical protein